MSEEKCTCPKSISQTFSEIFKESIELVDADCPIHSVRVQHERLWNTFSVVCPGCADKFGRKCYALGTWCAQTCDCCGQYRICTERGHYKKVGTGYDD